MAKSQNRQNCCTAELWTCELGYGVDTMFHRTYFLFSYINNGWGQRLRPPKICVQSHPPPLKSADFIQYLLITPQLSELAKTVQLLLIGSRLRAFQRAIDEVSKLSLSPPKGGSKSEFVIFVNKNKLKSNNLCYKVS